MRIIAVILLTLLSPTLWASDDCALDQDQQLVILAAIAKSVPGATFNPETREVALGAAESGLTIFAYGGCEDLGSTVTRTTPMNAPRTQEQAFAVARELADLFWNNEHVVAARLASESLQAGLAAARFESEPLNGVTLYSVRDAHFVELYVEHAYADGVDSVSIAWQGNF